MKQPYIQINSPLGVLGIFEQNEHIVAITYLADQEPEKSQPTPFLTKAAKQLNEYFSGDRKIFDLPLNPNGTAFQKKAWHALMNIPYGTTISYQQQAEIFANKNYTRAVGQANNKNPIPIIIPCHRVIGANGKMVGYASGVKIKEWLIELEQKNN